MTSRHRGSRVNVHTCLYITQPTIQREKWVSPINLRYHFDIELLSYSRYHCKNLAGFICVAKGLIDIIIYRFKDVCTLTRDPLCRRSLWGLKDSYITQPMHG